MKKIKFICGLYDAEFEYDASFVPQLKSRVYTGISRIQGKVESIVYDIEDLTVLISLK